jgi:flavorubredoxin
VNDFTGRDNAFLQDGQSFSTGKFNFRFFSTPHVPHCWDASLLFEETQSTLFCSDLFAHSGQQNALDQNVVTKAHEALIEEQQGPFQNSIPYTGATDTILAKLAMLKPQTLAVMHGSSYSGDGEQAIHALRQSLRDILGS